MPAPIEYKQRKELLSLKRFINRMIDAKEGVYIRTVHGEIYRVDHAGNDWIHVKYPDGGRIPLHRVTEAFTVSELKKEERDNVIRG